MHKTVHKANFFFLLYTRPKWCTKRCTKTFRAPDFAAARGAWRPEPDLPRPDYGLANSFRRLMNKPCILMHVPVHGGGDVRVAQDGLDRLGRCPRGAEQGGVGVAEDVGRGPV